MNRPRPAGRRTRSKYFKNNYNHIPKLRRVRGIPHVPPRPVRRRSNARRDDAAAAHCIIIEIHFDTRDTLVHATDLRVSLPAGPTDCACAFYSQTGRRPSADERTSGRTLTNAPKCAAAQWRSRARCPSETLLLLPSLKSRNERLRRLVVRLTATTAAAAAAARPTRHDGRQRGQFGTGRCVVSPDRKSRRIY